MTTMYNHMFSIAFTVITPNEADDVTADELRVGLHARLADLTSGEEILKACGAPIDTYVENKTLHSVWLQRLLVDRFQESGDQAFADAAAALSRVSGITIGPHGEPERLK